MRIPLSQPDIGEREIEAVTRVLLSGQLSLGPRVAQFEEAFTDYVGTRYAVAVNSGTSALQLCVKSLGIGAGDDVLTTSFSFVASANCLLYENAHPVFVDIDPVTMNIDPASVRDAISRNYRWDAMKSRHVNRRTGRVLKGILPVHVFGQPCDMQPLLEIARDFDLVLLEDACEAIGAEYGGRPVGTFGDAAVFAFYPNKQMTTAEGGMIVTDNPRIAAECLSMRNQGRDERADWLSHVRLGYNYRLSDLHCALGIVQLERIQELLTTREKIAASYSRQLAGVPGIILPHVSATDGRSWFTYVIRIAGARPRGRRDLLMQGLRERGIACQAYFPPIHKQPYFAKMFASSQEDLPNTEAAAESCLALPLFSRMTADQTREVCDAVREFAAMAHADSLNTMALKRHAVAGAD